MAHCKIKYIITLGVVQSPRQWCLTTLRPACRSSPWRRRLKSQRNVEATTTLRSREIISNLWRWSFREMAAVQKQSEMWIAVKAERVYLLNKAVLNIFFLNFEPVLTFAFRILQLIVQTQQVWHHLASFKSLQTPVWHNWAIFKSLQTPVWPDWVIILDPCQQIFLQK